MAGKAFVFSFATILIIGALLAVITFVLWSLYALFGIKGSRENWPGWMLYFDSGWPLFPRWLVGILLLAVAYAVGSIFYDLPGERLVFKEFPQRVIDLLSSKVT